MFWCNQTYHLYKQRHYTLHTPYTHLTLYMVQTQVHYTTHLILRRYSTQSAACLLLSNSSSFLMACNRDITATLAVSCCCCWSLGDGLVEMTASMLVCIVVNSSDISAACEGATITYSVSVINCLTVNISSLVWSQVTSVIISWALSKVWLNITTVYLNMLMSL